MSLEHVDVLVIGAGFSGIAAGYHLQRKCPERSFAVLESRGVIGGTWDLFRYPGIRSDSDMYTFGFSFRPWTGDKSIASGQSILDYLRATARQFGIDRHIRLRHRVVSAHWSSDDALWRVEVQCGPDDELVWMTCNFLLTCTGYYDYSRGYDPVFADQNRFRGRVVHPQFWPQDMDYAGKRVIVIGSGATAVTIVPAMAESASHVTMLQRSPSYVFGRPAVDAVALKLRKVLPRSIAHHATRWKNILMHLYFYTMARKKPIEVRQALMKMVQDAIGPHYDVNTHFNPCYHPWDQRLCFVPDNDLFNAIKNGRADVITDEIDRFTETGIRLKSGRVIDADIVVTATGLSLQLMSDIALSVDGTKIDPSKSMTYRGVMYSGIPNLASVFGYTNAPWTMRADLTLGFVCGLLNHMRRKSLRQCMPKIDEGLATKPFIDFAAGYVQRAVDKFPRQGSVYPWRVEQNYLRDIAAFKFGPARRGLRFSNPR